LKILLSIAHAFKNQVVLGDVESLDDLLQAFFFYGTLQPSSVLGQNLVQQKPMTDEIFLLSTERLSVARGPQPGGEHVIPREWRVEIKIVVFLAETKQKTGRKIVQ
jgi:hypothetical protein